MQCFDQLHKGATRQGSKGLDCQQPSQHGVSGGGVIQGQGEEALQPGSISAPQRRQKLDVRSAF